ncbi:MAG TPA: carboxypeptidase-like regulatory domain-containing protein [Flavobacteriaceae bacterium]|nr:carboxypeptidase-like regulatory domain-containing protein [Flavobacteriaceae bacterium]
MKSFSQDLSEKIAGKVIDHKNVLPNIHVVNQTTKLGTTSNDLGQFEIFAKENDILLFSSLQHKKKLIVVTSEILKQNKIIVKLQIDVNQLKEVTVHGLTGVLNEDVKKVPKDTIPKINFSFNPQDVYKFKSYSNTNSVPDARAMTDPTMSGGVGGGVGAGIPAFALIKEQKLRREVNRKREFPDKIISEFGKSFFTEELKIPENKIYHFITFCEPFNILDKYYSNNKMEVIKILKRESIEYHKIKNSN